MRCVPHRCVTGLYNRLRNVNSKHLVATTCRNQRKGMFAHDTASASIAALGAVSSETHRNKQDASAKFNANHANLFTSLFRKWVI